MNERSAPAKINLALVVGPRRSDGKHQLITVYERLQLADTVWVERAAGLEVAGFPEDTLVGAALEALAARARVGPGWRASVQKRIPVAAGLGGGSSDAAAALQLANGTLAAPLAPSELHAVAARLGADVPFFLESGPQLGRGDGTDLSPLELPRDYHVVLVLPHGAAKASTASVYEEFDARAGASGFEERCEELLTAIGALARAEDLALLPGNDLARSPLSAELRRLGAFRADVTGAGPAVYGLFRDEEGARGAAAALAETGRTWVTAPAWYG